MNRKVKTLNRPISPHLSIYVPQITSLASIWHRISGVFLICFLIGIISLLKLILLYNMSFNIYLIKVNFIYLGNLFTLFIFIYHGFNGFRHILWDLDYGLKKNNLKKSFYLLCSFIFFILMLNII